MSVRTPAHADHDLCFALLGGAVPLVLSGLAVWIALGGQNESLFVALNAAAVALPDTFWSCLTILGTGAAAFAVLTPLAARAPRLILAALAGGILAGLFTHLLKPTFNAARPAAELSADQIRIIGETLTHNALPSGHSVTAFALAGLAVAAASRPGRAALWALPLAALVALSRVAVGAHWPVDILVGGAGGWLCGIAGERLSRRWRLWRIPGARLLFALALLGNAIGLATSDLGYPLAHPLQSVLAGIAVGGVLIALAALWRDWQNWNWRWRGA